MKQRVSLKCSSLFPLEPTSNRHASTIACANSKTISPANRPPGPALVCECWVRRRCQPLAAPTSRTRSALQKNEQADGTHCQRPRPRPLLPGEEGEHSAKAECSPSSPRGILAAHRDFAPGYGRSIPFHMKTPSEICKMGAHVLSVSVQKHRGHTSARTLVEKGSIADTGAECSAEASERKQSLDSLTAQNSMTQTPLKKIKICSNRQEHCVSANALGRAEPFRNTGKPEQRSSPAPAAEARLSTGTPPCCRSPFS